VISLSNCLPLSLYSLLYLYSTPSSFTLALSLHVALPISPPLDRRAIERRCMARVLPEDPSGIRTPQEAHLRFGPRWRVLTRGARSEEHTSELQSRANFVCRLLL